MRPGPGELAVAGKQGCVERFSERHIGSIVRSEIIAKLPNPRQSI